MSSKILTQRQADILGYAVQNWEGLGLRTDYSGRYMYGKTCVGIDIGGDFYADFEDIIDFVEGYDEDLANLLARSVRWDSMGRGRIAYWPEISVEDREDDE